MTHTPVLLSEVLVQLRPVPGEVYVDGTFGGGGYTRAILDAAGCVVYGIDRDPDAIKRADALAQSCDRFIPVSGCFGDMRELMLDRGVDAVDGIVLDIGVSSFQLDEDLRGFSFMRDGPLDMRMSQDGPSAADVVNAADERDLASIIRQLGEEREASRIARRIVERRKETPFTQTGDLAACVEATLGGRRGRKIHPATKTFQAIRMFVNDELGELARALMAAERLLRAGGRLVVVSFHSLEDRLVKSFFRERAGKTGGGSRYMPEVANGPSPSFETLVKANSPHAEVQANPRARSAILRAATRTAADAWSTSIDHGLKLPELEVYRRAQ